MSAWKTLTILLLSARTMLAAFDSYGGSDGMQCAGGSQAHFYTERIRNDWWLCTPAGNVFWEVGLYKVDLESRTDWQGVNNRDFAIAKYVSHPTYDWQAEWCLNTVKRMRVWGFNVVDAASMVYIRASNYDTRWPGDDTIPDKLPFIESVQATYNAQKLHYAGTRPLKDLLAGIKATIYTGWRGSTISDYYDTVWADWLMGYWTTYPPYALHTDYILGVLVDDADLLWWVRYGSDYPGIDPATSTVATNVGWVTLVTAPVLAAAYNPASASTPVYADTENHTKTALSTYLQTVYANIAALNAVWASTYTQFASTGTPVVGELIGTGDGSVTFSATLAQPNPSMYSLQVLVGGVGIGGDKGNGVIAGPTAGGADTDLRAGLPVLIASGSLTGGELTVTFATPPANGATITVNYISCGFGCGTGLMDEDGTHAWVPTNSNRNVLTGGTAAMRADLEAFQELYARQYFSATKAVVNAFWPGILYMGPTNLQGAAGVWRAANDYLGVIRLTPEEASGPYWQRRIDWIHANAPDVPLMMWVGRRAVPDSYYYADPRGGACLVGDELTTQTERSAWYIEQVDWLRNTRTTSGIRKFVGMQFWQMYDNWVECANWGLLTPRDNAYDGAEAVSVAVPCSDVSGESYACGGEQQDFGAFITAGFKSVNRAWIPTGRTGTRGKTQIRGGRVR